MKRFILPILLLLSGHVFSQIQPFGYKDNSFSGQVNIGGGNYAVTDASAALQLRGTNRGFLPNRLTTVQRDAIVSPAPGLMIYNLTTNQYNVYTGASWEALGGTDNFIQNQYTVKQTARAWIDSLQAVTLRADSIYSNKHVQLKDYNGTGIGAQLLNYPPFLTINADKQRAADIQTPWGMYSQNFPSVKNVQITTTPTSNSYYKQSGEPLFFVKKYDIIDTFTNRWGNAVRGQPLHNQYMAGSNATAYAQRVWRFQNSPGTYRDIVWGETGNTYIPGALVAQSSLGSYAGNRFSVNGSSNGYINFVSAIDMNNGTPYGGGKNWWNTNMVINHSHLQWAQNDTINNVIHYRGGNHVGYHAYIAGGGINRMFAFYAEPMKTAAIGSAFAFYNQGSGDYNVLMGSTLIGDSVLTSITSEKLYTKGGVKFDITGANNFDIVNGTTHRFSGTTGNVMIGTTTDDLSNRLQVAGNSKFTGTVTVGTAPTNVNSMTVRGRIDLASGTSNIGIGETTMDSVTTGYENISIGKSSLRRLTTGYLNISVGSNNLNNQTTSYTNIAIGQNILNKSNTRGNIGIGWGSLRNYEETGNYHTHNLGLGPWSLETLKTGVDNMGIGADASGTIVSGNYTISIGSYTDFTGIPANSYRQSTTIIGRDSRFLKDTVYHSTILGHAVTGHRSYSQYLGRPDQQTYIHGAAMIGDTTYTNLNGEKLHVTGAVKFNITGSQNFDIVNGTTHRFSGTTGNVMLGTTIDDLTSRLQVAGGLKVTGKGTFDQTDLTGTLHEWKLGTTANTAAPNIAIARSGEAFSYSMWNADATASGQPYSQMYSVPASVVLNAGKRSTGHAGGVYAKTDSTYLYSDHTVAGGAPAASSSRFSLKGGVVRLSGSSFWMNTPLTIETQGTGIVFDGLYNGVKFRNSTDGDQFTIGVNISGVNSNTYEIFSHQTASAVVKITADRVSLSQVLNLVSSTAPTGTADASGSEGDIRRSSTNGKIWIKFPGGWYEFTGATF